MSVADRPNRPKCPASAQPGGSGAGTPTTPGQTPPDPASAGLTATQDRAILALLTEPSVARAAAAAGVGERTLFRWLADADFARAYREARARVFGASVARLVGKSEAAVEALASIMADPHAPHAARVSAARAVLAGAREGIGLDDLLGRVEALEVAAREDQRP